MLLDRPFTMLLLEAQATAALYHWLAGTSLNLVTPDTEGLPDRRYRIKTIWARVTLPLPLKVYLLPKPSIMPCL